MKIHNFFVKLCLSFLLVIAFANGVRSAPFRIQNTLLIRPFDGQTFGSISSKQIVSNGDPYRGWSWYGNTASYITVDEDGKSWLTIRAFDGKRFGSISSNQIVSNADPYRGWSWDGDRASYIVKTK